MKKIRKHFIFYGRVQGVGFRYQAYYAANALGLTGWVRNLWDGTVEMEVQGKGEEIEQLIGKLFRGKFIEIERMDSGDRDVQRESSFRIR